MPLFKSKEFKLALVGSIIVVALAVILPSITMRNYPLPDRFALARLALQAAAFPAIFLALYFNLIQLRKSMAKPRLEVIFSENGKSEISIHIPKDTPQGIEKQHELKLSVINKGNAITKLFQIDFIIPTVFRPRIDSWSAISLGIPSPPLNPLPNMSEGNNLVSFLSYEKVYCFVNKPARILTLLLGTFADKYDEYPNQFTITYKVFGDWAETQEGKLKVICKKSLREAPPLFSKSSLSPS